MSTSLLIFSLSFGIIVIFSVLFLIVKKEISIKFALIWIILFILLILAMIIPGLLESVTNILGFQTASNMILCIFIGLLVVINIATTVAISRRGKDLVKLTQELALLKKEMQELKQSIHD